MSGKRYFRDSLGTDSVPTATQTTGTLNLPNKNSRVRAEEAYAYLTNPAADITALGVPANEAGTTLKLICTGNSGTKKIKVGSTIKLASGVDYQPAADEVITLFCDGTKWEEQSRSLNHV